MKKSAACLFRVAAFGFATSVGAFDFQAHSQQAHPISRGHSPIASAGRVSFFPNQDAARWLLKQEGDVQPRLPALVLSSSRASSPPLPSSSPAGAGIRVPKDAMNDDNPFAPLAREIMSSKFQEGNTYTWLYSEKRARQGKPAAFDESGEETSDMKLIPSSWERYKITRVQYPLITIEMASKFNEADEYYTHHRMTVNLERQLNAVYDKGDWKIKFEYFDPATSQWSSIGLRGNNVQAFEEKFNVFMMQPSCQRAVVAGKPLKITKRSNNRSSTIKFTAVRPRRHSYTKSWYGFGEEKLGTTCDDLIGVALYKDFGEYSFALIEKEQYSSSDDESMTSTKTIYDITGL